MQNLFFLSWFLKPQEINPLLQEFVTTQKIPNKLFQAYQKHKSKLHSELLAYKAQGIEFITYSDLEYPVICKESQAAPWVISYYGNKELLKSPGLVVVGSRRPFHETLYWLDRSISKFKKGCLISGGAIGVDQQVHKCALSYEKETIAVLPCGLLELYPMSFRKLIKPYLKSENLLLLSQFHPKQKVWKPLFYPRNYFMSSLSHHIVIAQAGFKSGTMVTARYALDLGREVYTLPAFIWEESFSGNITLLSEGAHQIIDLNLIQK